MKYSEGGSLLLSASVEKSIQFNSAADRIAFSTSTLSGIPMDWSREEVEAIVADYLHMLTLELAGQSYSKSEHRRMLQAKLNNRSDGSIEFKHGNISAAMGA